jgi:hypothetical protein
MKLAILFGGCYNVKIICKNKQEKTTYLTRHIYSVHDNSAALPATPTLDFSQEDKKELLRKK